MHGTQSQAELQYGGQTSSDLLSGGIHDYYRRILALDPIASCRLRSRFAWRAGGRDTNCSDLS